jgi:hypothetical protein
LNLSSTEFFRKQIEIEFADVNLAAVAIIGWAFNAARGAAIRQY